MAVPTLSVNPETLVVNVNGSENLKITTNGTYGLSYDTSYLSHQDSDSGKMITGAKVGEVDVTITATASDGTGDVTTKVVKVTINDANGLPLITADKSELTLIAGGLEQIITLTTNAASYTATADNTNVTVTAVPEENKIKVTGAAAGNAVITITGKAKTNTEEPGKAKSIIVNAVVKETPTLSVSPSPTVEFKANKKQSFVITTNQTDYNYVIEPEHLATFNKDTKQLSGLNTGVGTITFYVNKDQEGELSKKVNFTILEPDITTLNISPTDPSVVVGGTVIFNVSTNAADYTVSNSNPSIASYDKETSTLQAIAVGSTALTFEAQYGEGEKVTKKINVTIEAAPVEPINLLVSPNTITTVINGDTVKFSILTNADDYTVELSNNSLATFDKGTGILSTSGVGDVDVTITATKEGTVSQTVTVPVTIVDVSLIVSATELTIVKGEEASFEVISNVPTEVKTEIDDPVKIGISKNNTKINISGEAVGVANVMITVRDKIITIPVKVIDITKLIISATPKVVYVGRPSIIEVNTNANSFTAESSNINVVQIVKINNTITVSGLDNGVSILTFTAQVEGGDLETISWEITSIKESSYTREESEKILTDASTTVEEKITAFINDVGEIGKFVNNMITYNTIMDPNAETTLEDERAAAKNYSLYIQIKDAIEEEDYAEFKVKFDIINMVFTNYAKSAFDEFALFRYDQAWMDKWGETSLYTFQNLCTLICTLCSIKTRTSNLDSIDLDTALDTTKIELTEIGVNNIKKYYIV